VPGVKLRESVCLTAITLAAPTPVHRPSTSRCTGGRPYPLIDGMNRPSTGGAFERPGPRRRQHEGVPDCRRSHDHRRGGAAPTVRVRAVKPGPLTGPDGLPITCRPGSGRWCTAPRWPGSGVCRSQFVTDLRHRFSLRRPVLGFRSAHVSDNPRFLLTLRNLVRHRFCVSVVLGPQLLQREHVGLILCRVGFLLFVHLQNQGIDLSFFLV
jgi:hypothetical protein